MTKFVNTWKTILFRYISDNSLALPTKIKTSLIKQALNELHPAMQFTMETGNKNKHCIVQFMDDKIQIHTDSSSFFALSNQKET